MSFGENLKLIRKERQITQEQLAEMLDVSRQAVSKWEAGVGYPETEKLLIISKVLDVSLDYLLLDKEILEEKEHTDPKTAVYVPNGKIAIPTFDKTNTVVCHAVKSVRILFSKKDEPKYILNGVDKVGFWGDHLVLLGWYGTLEDIQREIAGITEAIRKGEMVYDLKYAADIEYKGLLGQPKLVKL